MQPPMLECRQYRVDNQARTRSSHLTFGRAGGHEHEAAPIHLAEVATQHSRISESAKLLVRVCYRFGQECHVIRNPILTGVRAEQIALVPAYACDPRWALLESHRKPCAIDRHGRPRFLITERSDCPIRSRG